MKDIERTCVFGSVLVEVEEHSQIDGQTPAELDEHDDAEHYVDEHGGLQ